MHSKTHTMTLALATAIALAAGAYGCTADANGAEAAETAEAAQRTRDGGPATPDQANDATPAELTKLTTDINAALQGLVPDRTYHYCTNGIPFNVATPPARDPIACRTVVFYKDANGVPVLENGNPNDDIIMDGFASGQRQVCSTSYFWRNGRTLANGQPSWTVAGDTICNGTANVVIDSLQPLNRDVEISLAADPTTGATFPTVHELRTIRLEADGTKTVMHSSFQFGEAQVFLRNFTVDANGAATTTNEIRYYRTRPELLP